MRDELHKKPTQSKADKVHSWAIVQYSARKRRQERHRRAAPRQRRTSDDGNSTVRQHLGGKLQPPSTQPTASSGAPRAPPQRRRGPYDKTLTGRDGGLDYHSHRRYMCGARKSSRRSPSRGSPSRQSRYEGPYVRAPGLIALLPTRLRAQGSCSGVLLSSRSIHSLYRSFPATGTFLPYPAVPSLNFARTRTYVSHAIRSDLPGPGCSRQPTQTATIIAMVLLSLHTKTCFSPIRILHREPTQTQLHVALTFTPLYGTLSPGRPPVPQPQLPTSNPSRRTAAPTIQPPHKATWPPCATSPAWAAPGGLRVGPLRAPSATRGSVWRRCSACWSCRVAWCCGVGRCRRRGSDRPTVRRWWDGYWSSNGRSAGRR